MNDNRPSDEYIQDLLADYAASRCLQSRDKVVLHYRSLVESIARKFSGSGEPIEDLIQEGYIGLINCIDLYDSSKGVKFSTYATHFVIGQIKHALRDKGKIIKEPAWLQELNHKMTRVIDSLYQELGRYPTDYEIGKLMHLPEKTISDMLTAREIFKVTSLDGNVDEGHEQHEIDNITEDGCEIFTLPLEDKIVLETATAKLKLIEQKVIQEFYYAGLSQTEIAKKIGISCNYVSHILKNGTQKLRRILVSEEMRDAHIQMQLANQKFKGLYEPNISVIDDISGLYNTEYLMARFDEELNRASRYKDQVAFAILRILKMEKFSDKFGINRQNMLIFDMANLVKDNIRKCDIAGRLSEYEFGLILPYTGNQASVVCTRLGGIFINTRFSIENTDEILDFDIDMAFSVYPTDALGAQQLISIARSRIDDSVDEDELMLMK